MDYKQLKVELQKLEWHFVELFKIKPIVWWISAIGVRIIEMDPEQLTKIEKEIDAIKARNNE